MRHISPLRYPGGKGPFSPYLQEVISLNGLQGCAYFEPFAGGAGAALCLLTQGIVSSIHLNDLDYRITSFWRSILDETNRFVDAVMTVPLTLEEWHKQRDIYYNTDPKCTFEVGFSTFYLNRCNRSGVLFGAAPIGGYAQSGKWRLDARFYRSTLANRIGYIADFRHAIHITQLDALTFLQRFVVPSAKTSPVFAYLDPPYYLYGNRLYLSHFSSEDHSALSQQLHDSPDLAWIASYNRCQFIEDLYRDFTVINMPVRYSLQKKQKTRELVIASQSLRLPVKSGTSR